MTGWVDTEPATTTDTDCTCRMNITLASLSEWCVKDIKYCLFQAQLNTFGIKPDLVDRLYNYMTTFQINSEPVTWAGPCRGPSRRRCRTSSAATYLQLQDKKPLIILYNLQGWIFIFQLWQSPFSVIKVNTCKNLAITQWLNLKFLDIKMFKLIFNAKTLP